VAINANVSARAAVKKEGPGSDEIVRAFLIFAVQTTNLVLPDR